jgi:hypothetical protein
MPSLKLMQTRGPTGPFKTDFDSFACLGDTITAEVEGFTLTACIYYDEHAGSPEDQSQCFWPSLDPDKAGYIGPKSKSTLRRQMKKARKVLADWNLERWFYCGIAVTVARNGVELTGKFDHALWGIECNYTGGRHKNPNTYLRDVANEHAQGALDAAKEKVAALAKAIA